MSKINRSSVINQQVNITGLNSAVDVVPTQLNNVVSPTLDLNPRFSMLTKGDNATTSGARTLITAPTDKDLYLTYLWLSLSKNVTSDCTSIILTATIGGATSTLLRMDFQSLTAESDNISLCLPYPVKVDRGATISYTASFTAGAFSKSAGIGYFILE